MMVPAQPPLRIANRLRRQLLLAGLGPALGWVAGGAAATTAPVDKGRAARALVFPRDHGSHPDSRIEWWYITGHTRLDAAGKARVLGFQLTFFRARVDVTQQLQSRFAARQLLFAHAAISDVQGQRFRHDQRIARAGFDVVSASETDTRIRLNDWSLKHDNGTYQARIKAADFNLELDFSTTQPVLLQGADGYSRKGPKDGQASFYYSQPQLAFAGHVVIDHERVAVTGAGAPALDPAGAAARPGAAWLDHEWSENLLDPNAVGWDWVGINLFDGSALTAFRIRDKSGSTLWDGGSFRRPAPGGGIEPQVFGRGETVFLPVRGWKSPRTDATYPVEWQLRTPAGHFVLRALLDDQELDSRNSTGAIYWEGLCDLYDGQNQHVGRGYLELTGYAGPLVL